MAKGQPGEERADGAIHRRPPMANPRPRWARLLLGAALCAVLAGCGSPRLAAPRQEAAVLQPATPRGATSPVPEASPVPALGGVVWATSSDPTTNAPSDIVSSFAPEAPRIAAFVLIAALPAGTTIAADWEYNDTSLDAFSRQVVLPTAAERTWLSFHIDRSGTDPWPIGIYEVTISLDGQIAQQATVEVVAAA